MSSRGLSLPDSTRERLDQFRQRVRVIKIAEGILAGLFGLVLSYLAVFIIDRFIDTSALVRTSLLLSGSVGLAVLFPLKCHRWVWGTRSMEQDCSSINSPRWVTSCWALSNWLTATKISAVVLVWPRPRLIRSIPLYGSEISPTRSLDRSIDSGRRRSRCPPCWRFWRWRLCQQQASTRCLAG
jgi:hypothetical protein